jgi:hypothetical protein
MAEGEPPESGSHDWNKESAADTAKRQRAEYTREQAEHLQHDRKEDIVSRIASLKRAADTPLYDSNTPVAWLDRAGMERANVKNKLKYERKAGLYSYMRDTHEAQTVGDRREAAVPSGRSGCGSLVD